MMLAVDLTRNLVLKAIPGEIVKSNEERMWCKIWPLQGLNHPNIVRPISSRVRRTLPPFLMAYRPHLSLFGA
jgi:hypothetical protein